jgi:glycosyltransferase involved in cell wall biosynthesis
MNILFLSDNFWPESNAPASRTFEHCTEWVRLGARVTVITCAPNFPAGKVYPGFKNKLRTVADVNGIRVVRVWSYMAPNAGFARRILDFLSFAISSFAAGLLEKADVIVATSPQFFTTWSAVGLSIFKRRPWVFELRDLWPESLVAVGIKQQGWLLAFLEKVELALYRNAAHVVVVTEAFKENLVRRGISKDKISVVYGGVDLDRFKPVPRDEELVSRLRVSEKFVVGYVGTHGMAHGLETFIEAADQLPPRVHLLFVGDGAERSRLDALVNGRGLKNVSMIGQVSKEEIVQYWSVIDVALVPLRKSDTFLTVVPSKIFEAAAMGKPILLGVDGQARTILERFGAGLYFAPEDSSAFSAAVLSLMADEKLYSKLQEGCREMAKAFERKNLASKMLQVLQRVAKK